MNRRDLEAAQALASDDAEIFTLRSQLEGRAYRGREGLAQAMADASDWADVQVEVDEIRECPDGVVGLVRLKARGNVSGIELDVPTGWHFRLAQGRIAYCRAYSEPADALRAAGAD